MNAAAPLPATSPDFLAIFLPPRVMSACPPAPRLPAWPGRSLAISSRTTR